MERITQDTVLTFIFIYLLKSRTFNLANVFVLLK